MKIIERVESRERCAEAGWYAFDYILDANMNRDFIRSLKPLGSFVFLEMLSRPFFKIETDHYMIKGMEKDSFFRVAVHGDYLEQLDDIEHFITKG